MCAPRRDGHVTSGHTGTFTSVGQSRVLGDNRPLTGGVRALSRTRAAATSCTWRFANRGCPNQGFPVRPHHGRRHVPVVLGGNRARAGHADSRRAGTRSRLAHCRQHPSPFAASSRASRRMASSCRMQTPTSTPIRRRPKPSSCSPRRRLPRRPHSALGAGDGHGGRVRAALRCAGSAFHADHIPDSDAARVHPASRCRRRFPSRRHSPSPAGPHDQLERLEHMRVSLASLTVTGPSSGTVDETAATGDEQRPLLRRHHRPGPSVPRAGHSSAGSVAERKHSAHSALGRQPGAHRRGERSDRRAARPHRALG